MQLVARAPPVCADAVGGVIYVQAFVAAAGTLKTTHYNYVLFFVTKKLSRYESLGGRDSITSSDMFEQLLSEVITTASDIIEESLADGTFVVSETLPRTACTEYTYGTTEVGWCKTRKDIHEMANKAMDLNLAVCK